MNTNNMNIDKINKMKYDLIDELTDKQVQLLVESMIVDKYTMNKDERISNENGLIDIFQYLIDNGKIVHVLNGLYGSYNKLLYDMNFKGFKYDSSIAKTIIENFDMSSDELFERDLKLLKEIIDDKE